MKNFLKKSKNAIKTTALTLTALAAMYANNAEGQVTVSQIKNDTTSINIPDSLDHYLTFQQQGFFQAPNMTEYLANGLAGELLVRDTSLTQGNLVRENAILTDNTTAQSTIDELTSIGAYNQTNTNIIALDVTQYDNLEDAWSGIFNTFFGGSSVPSNYEYKFLGPVHQGTQVTVYEASHPTIPVGTFTATNNGGVQNMTIEDVFYQNDSASFNFELRDLNGVFMDKDTLVENIHAGNKYLNFLGVDSVPTNDSIFYFNTKTEAGAQVDVSDENNNFLFSMIADATGDADTILYYPNETEKKFTVDVSKAKFYSIDDTVVTANVGLNIETNLPLTAWPTYSLLIDPTNADEIVATNAFDANDTIFNINTATGEISEANQQALVSLQRPENSLTVNVRGDNQNMSEYATDTWTLNPGVNLDSLMISPIEVFHYNMLGYATKEANYIVKDANDTSKVFLNFVAPSNLVIPGDTATTNYEITFDNDVSSTNVQIEGSKTGYQDSTFTKQVFSDAYENMSIQLVPNNVGIEEIVNDAAQFNAFPIPFHNKLTVQYENRNDLDNTKLELIDMTGRVIKAQYNINPFDNQIQINTTDLPNGNYMLRSMSNEGNEAPSYKKIIRN